MSDHSNNNELSEPQLGQQQGQQTDANIEQTSNDSIVNKTMEANSDVNAKITHPPSMNNNADINMDDINEMLSIVNQSAQHHLDNVNQGSNESNQNSNHTNQKSTDDLRHDDSIPNDISKKRNLDDIEIPTTSENIDAKRQKNIHDVAITTPNNNPDSNSNSTVDNQTDNYFKSDVNTKDEINDLDLEFEKAIAKHHRETSVPPENEHSNDQEQHQSQEPSHYKGGIDEHFTKDDDGKKDDNANLDEHAESNLHQQTESNNSQVDTPPHITESNEPPSELKQYQQAPFNEKEDLQMIANELEQATSSNKNTYQDQKDESDNEDKDSETITNEDSTKKGEEETTKNETVERKKNVDEDQESSKLAEVKEQHSESDINLKSSKSFEDSHEPVQSKSNATENDKDDIKLNGNIPANSELFNTSAAFAAYNALSSQLPPLAALANAQLSSLPLSIIAPDFLPPRIQLLINTLPTLDNLATQLLRIVALGPYQKIIDLASNAGTPSGAAYRDLTSLFEFTKKLYSEEDPFLTVEHIAPGIWKEGDRIPSIFSNRDQSIESTLRKVNLATFLAATLGTIEVGFFYLNESFLDVFCPSNNLDPNNSLSNMTSTNNGLQSSNSTIGDTVGKLLKPQAILYLDLKTQAYISAIEAGERSHQEILEDIFPKDLEVFLLGKRDVKSLSPVELDFIDRCKTRKEILLNYPIDKNLSEEYEWFSFLNNLFDYVAKNMGFLVWGKKGRSTFKPTITSFDHSNINKFATPHSSELLTSSSLSPAPKDGTKIDTSGSNYTTNQAPVLKNHLNSRDPEMRDITTLLPSEIQEQQIHLRFNLQANPKSLQRRPWTREEEKALRHALEMKGPSWSTILELFGAGGKISETLKNRTQVQLKDKARNWKMFFLKSGLPVPRYLLKVTGDLERDDKLRARFIRSKKTAAAPVPNPSSRKSKKNDKSKKSNEDGNESSNDTYNNDNDDVVNKENQEHSTANTEEVINELSAPNKHDNKD